MYPENQAQIKKIVESSDKGEVVKNLILVLEASDIDGALISAKTVTDGDLSSS